MADGHWHTDPAGSHELRYHDGEKWTHHVSNGGQTAIDPLPQKAVDPLPAATHPAPTVPMTMNPPTAPTVAIYAGHAGAMHSHAQHRRVGKKRNPWGVWALSAVTLGIYGWYWYYKVNEETREYSPAVHVQPGIALLAYMFGGLTCGVAVVATIVKTGGRISQCQQETPTRSRCSGFLGILFAVLLGTHIVYYQSQLNKIWDSHGSPAPGTAV
jgi:hypothetical protein